MYRKGCWIPHQMDAMRPSSRMFRRLGITTILVCLFACLAHALLLPEASNTVVYEKGGAVIDASHSDQGYVMIRRQSSKKQKLRISLGKTTMTYDLDGSGAYEVFPLQMGDGKYKAELFEQVSGTKYSPVASISFSAAISDAVLPYLYPNQYVWYDANSQAVAKSMEICAGATTDAQKVEAVYRYIVGNAMYDYVFAMEVGQGKWKGYIPDPDKTMMLQSGVCFDFSALMACMLRAQGVATQMVIGYADKTYHAWNNVLVDGTWYQYDVTMVICQGNVKQYTPERVY